ncbi:MAG: hypothetical protein ACMXX7_01240 [Candidatus Woesearchaeota archaeon]
MNKKAVGFKELIYMTLGVIFLVVMISFFYGDQVRNTIEGTLDNLFDVDMEERTRISHQTRAESLDTYSGFIEDITLIEQSDKDFCIAPLEKIPDTFFERFIINMISKDATSMSVQLLEKYEDGRNSRRVYDLSRDIPVSPIKNINLRPCLLGNNFKRNVHELYNFISGNTNSLQGYTSAVHAMYLQNNRHFHITTSSDSSNINIYRHRAHEINNNMYLVKQGNDLCFIQLQDPRWFNGVRGSITSCTQESPFSVGCIDIDEEKSLLAKVRQNPRLLCSEIFAERLNIEMPQEEPFEGSGMI